MRINTEYYRIFYYVAKYKSISKAATVLNANQPNISRYISKLEEQLNTPLFIRTNRGVHLTHSGGILFSHVASAFSELEKAEAALLIPVDSAMGSVSIATSEISLHGFLLTILKDFHTQHPNIHVRLMNETPANSLEAVRSGDADFAIISDVIPDNPELTSNVIRQYHETAVCSKEYENLTNRTLHLWELSDYPLIGQKNNTVTNEFYMDFFSMYGLTFEPDIETATADQIAPFIIANLGIGFIPETFFTFYKLEGSLFRLNLYEPIPTRCLYLIESKERKLDPSTELLKERLLLHVTNHQ